MKRAWLILWMLATLFVVAQTQPPTATPANPAELEAKVKANPSSLPLRVQLGWAYLGNQRYTDAIQIFEDVLALDYSSYSSHIGLGLAMYREGNLQGAQFEFKQSTLLFPTKYEGWFNLGVVQARQGGWSDAAVAFSRAIGAGDRTGAGAASLKPVYLALADAYGNLKQLSRQVAVLTKAHEAMPVDRQITLLLAQAMVQAGQSAQAIPYLYDVLKADPANVTAVGQLADIYQARGLSNWASRELNRALEAARQRNDSDAMAQILVRESALLQTSAPQTAAKLLQRAASLDKNLWQAQYNLGVSRLNSGDLLGALTALQAAYQAQPNSSDVLLALATTYDRQNNIREAYQYAGLAARLATGKARADAQVVQGKEGYKLGSYTEATGVLKEAVRQDPSNAQAWLWLGLSQYAQGAYVDAVKSLEQANTLSPSPAARLNLGAAYLADKHFSDAEQLLSQIVVNSPGNAEAWYNLGWSLKALSRDSEAQRAWKKALSLGYEPAKNLVSR